MADDHDVLTLGHNGTRKHRRIIIRFQAVCNDGRDPRRQCLRHQAGGLHGTQLTAVHDRAQLHTAFLQACGEQADILTPLFRQRPLGIDLLRYSFAVLKYV